MVLVGSGRGSEVMLGRARARVGAGGWRAAVWGAYGARAFSSLTPKIDKFAAGKSKIRASPCEPLHARARAGDERVVCEGGLFRGGSVVFAPLCF